MKLTRREQEIIQMVDMRNREIAEKLGIGIRGVESHIRSILKKMESPNRMSAWLKWNGIHK